MASTQPHEAHTPHATNGLRAIKLYRPAGCEPSSRITHHGLRAIKRHLRAINCIAHHGLRAARCIALYHRPPCINMLGSTNNWQTTCITRHLVRLLVYQPMLHHLLRAAGYQLMLHRPPGAMSNQAESPYGLRAIIKHTDLPDGCS